MIGLTRNSHFQIQPSLEGAIVHASSFPVENPLPRRNIFQAILMRRWIVMVAIVLALIGGFVKYQIATPMYMGVASLVVEQSRPNIIANDPAGVMTGTSNYLFTQVELIRSRKILAEVAKMPEIIEL